MRQLTLFDVLTPTSEGNDIEFKAARGGLPGAFWETYSAMANTQGGRIILGVSEKQGVLAWDGVPDAAALRTVLWNQLNDRNKISANLLTEGNLETVDRDGRTFLVVAVPRASRAQRPVYVGPNPLVGTFRRAEEGDYRCSEDEVRRMLADQSSTPADAAILEHFGIADFDSDTLKQYRNRFASRDPDHPWLSEDDEGLLYKLGALRRDRASGLQGATVAGLVMFATFDALREGLPAFHLDYREKLSADPQVRWTDRLVPDGSWQSNAFQFYQRVVQRLAADLKIPFQLSRELYRRDDTIVHEALREAVVNALIHADHHGQGGIVIERYADRIELSNPGSLLLSREQLLRGGISECRNKSLQLMFQMIGGGEKAGSGMDKIRSGWRSQHWRSPKIEESVQPDRVKLVLPMVSLIPDEVDRALNRRFGERYTQLSPLGVQAVVTAQIEGAVTNGRLQEITGEHPSDITIALQGLVRNGLLRQQNQRRWTSYSVPEDSPQYAQDSPQSDPSSPQSDPSSPQYAEDSLQSAGDSPRTGSGLHGTPTVDPRLWQQAAPARERPRMRIESLKVLIEALCQGRWLTSRELGQLLDREPDNLQTRVLTAMVREQRLVMRYPDVPNRPDQAYQAVEAGQ
jgi:ATP-dependent DNA helicase RecG